MNALPLHEFHQRLDARFFELNGSEAVADFGDAPGEQTALRTQAGLLDLSFRGRICLTGADRIRFLHGQVTNDVKRLPVGAGCYAALVTAKGKMESDLFVYNLRDELLLDFEPGLTDALSRRLNKYIVADDVQVVDVASDYGMLSVQGPAAGATVKGLGFFPEIPAQRFNFTAMANETLGELYLMNQPRLGSAGFDLFVPVASLGAVADRLLAATKAVGGRACGWQAFDVLRMEAGIPRFGVDMDETNLPLECGIADQAVSYTKGCYIGQEIINRVHSFGHVTKELRGLRLADDLPTLPVRGDRLFHAGREAGYVTSAVKSPWLNGQIALGYVRKEMNQTGTVLTLRQADRESQAEVVVLPFLKK
jgi:folate-binding protein YgfZ